MKEHGLYGEIQFIWGNTGHMGEHGSYERTRVIWGNTGHMGKNLKTDPTQPQKESENFCSVKFFNIVDQSVALKACNQQHLLLIQIFTLLRANLALPWLVLEMHSSHWGVFRKLAPIKVRVSCRCSFNACRTKI